MADGGDLIRFLNPNFNSSPPTDLRFWFKDHNGVIEEVKAHRVILAAASDVFNREFFGSLKAEENIEIKDVNQETFLLMIEFIYNKKTKFLGADVTTLASMYYLGDKYNIKPLRIEVLASISELKIDKENVLKVAIIAEDSILLQPFSEALFDVVATFINQKLGGIVELCGEDNQKHAVVIFKILSRIGRIRGDMCGNCDQYPCLNGVRLSEENFISGAKIVLAAGGHERLLTQLSGGNKFGARRIEETEENASDGHLFTSGWYYKC